MLSIENIIHDSLRDYFLDNPIKFNYIMDIDIISEKKINKFPFFYENIKKGDKNKNTPYIEALKAIDSLKHDEELNLNVLDGHIGWYKHMVPSMKLKKNITLKALKLCHIFENIWEHVPFSLKKDEDFVLELIKSKIITDIKYVDIQLSTNIEFNLKLIQLDVKYLSWVKKHNFHNHTFFMKRAIKIDPRLIYLSKKKMLEDKDYYNEVLITLGDAIETNKISLNEIYSISKKIERLKN